MTPGFQGARVRAVTSGRTTFPILGASRAKYPTPIVPWAFVAPHEAWAEKNHGGQSLARLAERGGLDPLELLAVVEGRPLKVTNMTAGQYAAAASAAALELEEKIAAWSRDREGHEL